MKTLTFISMLIFVSCKSYDVTTSSYESNNVLACNHPSYVSTMEKQDLTGQDLTLYSLIKLAKTTHGNDVSIQNVRWDMQGKKRVSAIFDVVRCSTDTTAR